MAVVVSTGLYKEPLLPAFAYEWDEDRIAAWMIAEIVEGIEGTGIRAGVIKLATSDAGVPARRAKDATRRCLSRAGDRRRDNQPHAEWPHRP